MAIKEVDIQTELKNAVIAAGGYSYKCSNRFLVGILDLFIQLPGYPTLILEVKYEKKALKNGTIYCELSPHQARNCNSINNAGGNAGWIMVTRRGPGEYAWHAGRTPVATYILDAIDSDHVKRRGAPWPIYAIIKEVIKC